MKYALDCGMLMFSLTLCNAQDQHKRPLVINRNVRRSAPSSWDVERAAIRDTDIESLRKFGEYLCKVNQLNKGNLQGENLMNARSYWNQVAPKLTQKFDPHEKEELTIVELISHGLNVTLQPAGYVEYNAQQVAPTQTTNDPEELTNSFISIETSTPVACSVRIYDEWQCPIKINTDNHRLKHVLEKLITALVSKYTYASAACTQPKLFPANADTFLQNPQKCEPPQKKHEDASAQSSDDLTKAQRFSSSNSASTSTEISSTSNSLEFSTGSQFQLPADGSYLLESSTVYQTENFKKNGE